MKPTFFKSQAEFRKWLEKNHDQASELWVGLQKTGSAQKGLVYKEALDEALCFGWIDGVRKSIDESRWMIRFTPRKPRSIWSAINIKRAGELKALGQMKPPGLAAFEGRDGTREKQYSYEREALQLEAAYEKRLRANKKAWDFFESQPPWYRRAAQFWVMSAKKEETRSRRLEVLIESSEQGKRAPPLLRPSDRAEQ
jgi:uncharacterized protein YdeI (YjbR/CyaY-like superfamily)